MEELALPDNRVALENDPNAPVLGNPDGDVTVVEFFDYNCPYCRRVMAEVKGLLADDDNVRLVYREWPILGDGSVFAARAALAAR
jgi:protein-disulfide isomerase